MRSYKAVYKYRNTLYFQWFYPLKIQVDSPLLNYNHHSHDNLLLNKHVLYIKGTRWTLKRLLGRKRWTEVKGTFVVPMRTHPKRPFPEQELIKSRGAHC